MSAILQGKTLYLTGTVGEFWYDEDTFNSIDILMAIGDLPPTDQITVHINSPGGVASEGAAIFAMLNARPGDVDIVVDGIAASAGSLIAMAGKSILMSPGSVMMIHDPAGYTAGNSDEHSKTIEQLEALATAYANIYARRSGKSPAKCRAMMKAETWLTPEDAVEAGFATAITAASKASMVAAFDYSKFRHAPARLVAMAREHNWAVIAPPNSSLRKVGKMSTDNTGHASATARIRAIMKADDAEGRADLAEHLAYETDLDPDAAIAIMKAAPKPDDRNNEWRPPHMRAPGPNGEWRANAAGLRGGYVEKQESRLVAAMKSRDGGK